MPVQANSNCNSSAIMTNPLQGKNFYRPLMYIASNAVTSAIANTAYFTFIGLTTLNFTPLQLYISQPAVGTGTASVGLGLFSSTIPPNGSNLVMTPIVTASTVTYDSTNLRLTNTTPFASLVSAGVYLWAGFISNYSTNQGDITAIQSILGNLDMFQILVGSTVLAFTSGSPISANVISPGTNVGIYPVITF